MESEQKGSEGLKEPASPANESEADRILDQNRRHNTSGLSWDEVADDDKKKAWRQITEMGEGD